MAKTRFAANRENVLPEQWPVVKEFHHRKRARKEVQENMGSEKHLPLEGMGLGGEKRAKRPAGQEGERTSAPDCASAPTDFSNLKTLLQGEQKHEPDPCRPRLPLEDHTNKLPTVRERRVQNLADAYHVEMLGSLLGASFSTLSRDPLLNPVAAAGRQTEQSQLPAKPDACTLRCKDPPLDWSLKRVIRLSAASPLTCCEPLQSQSDAMMSGMPPAQLASHSSSQEKVHSALRSWRFPESPLPPSIAAGLATMEGGSAFLLRRHSSWQESVRELFLKLRCKACTAFYCIAPEGSKKPLVAFFGGPGTGGRRRIHAWMSHSTHGLRTMLSSEEHGLNFGLPHAHDLQTVPEVGGDFQVELADLGQERLVKTPTIDGTPRSLLYFEGLPQVQGFFEFLYNNMLEIFTSASDVPLLIAPVPFVNANLQQLDLKVLPNSVSNGGLQKFRAELRGLIPPWGLIQLSQALMESQPHNFQMKLETHPGTAAFNFGKGVGNGAGFRSMLRAPRDTGESMWWSSSPAELHGAVLKGMTFEGSHFVAELQTVSKPLQPR